MSISNRSCKIVGCTRRVDSLDWCSMHYRRWKRNGDPMVTIRSHELHGEAGTRLHRIWVAIRSRTSNPTLKEWGNYGGRGIKVSPEWRRSFLAFKRDVIQGYADHLTFDRIDNNGNYEPGNVRWTDRRTQSLNQRHLTTKNKSGYRGVFFGTHENSWIARINSEGKTYHLGRFATAKDAAIAYNKAAKKYHGELANLNTIVV